MQDGDGCGFTDGEIDNRPGLFTAVAKMIGQRCLKCRFHHGRFHNTLIYISILERQCPFEAPPSARQMIKTSALGNAGLTLILQLYIKEGEDIAARS
jgi:hypothetical protein